MKFNFKKVSAIGTSILLAGMSMGVAAAANYPSPFVVGGTADVAIVYGTGTGVSALDVVQSGNIQTDLQSFMGASTTGDGDVTTEGEIVSLDTGSGGRIYLNNSINKRETLTKSNLPTVLADTSFSGNVDATITQSIVIGAGHTASSASNLVGSNTVVFAKQPKSGDEPVIGLSMGNKTWPMYNLSATFKAINFSHSDSEGETLTLFGKDYVISTATTPGATGDLVLFSTAEEVTLTKSGVENPSVSVTISGTDYTVTLLNGDSTSATIDVDGESKDITEGSSKKIGGIDIAVKSVTSSDVAGITATLLVGAEKITFKDGSRVTTGSEGTAIKGTDVTITGGPGAATELRITVYRPSANDDALLEGETFVDPVFGSIKLEFVGLSESLDADTRGTISVQHEDNDQMSITMTHKDGDTATIAWAHNVSSRWWLADDSNYSIYPYEHANVTEDEYLLVGNDEFGTLVRVYNMYNSSDDDHTKNTLELEDVFDGEIYDATFTSHVDGYVTIKNKQYDVNFSAAGGGTHRAQLKYPSSDSPSGDDFVVYPTIQTDSNARIAFYMPMNITMTSFAGTGITPARLYFPDGDGYTSITIEFGNDDADRWNITHGSTTDEVLTLNVTAFDSVDFTIGRVIYNLTSTATQNVTRLYINDLESAGNAIDNPGILVFESEDDNNNYEAIFVDLEDDPPGTSTNGVGVDDVLFSTVYGHYSATKQGVSITQDVDWFGTLTEKDSETDSDQATLEIKVPSSQVYAQLYVGEETAAITSDTTTTTGATTLGDVLVKDSEVSSVATKNLIIVGGSCINSAAASLVGGALCGPSWTDTTGIGSGEFLIKGYSDSSLAAGKLALLVAGYDAADTVNAATYLRTQVVDTDKEYKGTSATEATLVTEETTEETTEE